MAVRAEEGLKGKPPARRHPEPRPRRHRRLRHARLASGELGLDIYDMCSRRAEKGLNRLHSLPVRGSIFKGAYFDVWRTSLP
jgi:hypothetical protein